MRRVFLVLTIIFFIRSNVCAFAEIAENKVLQEAPVTYTAAQQVRNVHVFAEKNLFGLKDSDGNIIAPAKYQKIIMTGRNGWIVQKNNKYGLMDEHGNYLIKPVYRNGDRLLGRYIKLGNKNDYGIYNEYGETILPPEYSKIELLYGRMFLTYKDYRYGITDFKGKVLIPNICDDIYMPDKGTLKIKYLGNWYELNNVTPESLSMPDIIVKSEDNEFTLSDFLDETALMSQYSVLTLSDYLIKVISSVSPAHEQTIDDLILSHGVDTVGILKNSSWLPKYPLTFAKNYYETLRNPFNGPLADKRNKLKNKR